MKKRNIAIALVMILLICIFSGCTTEQENSDNQVKEIDEMAAVQTEKVQLSIYYPDMQKNMLKREIRDIEKEEALKSVNNLTQVVINEVLSGPSNQSGLKNIYPNTISMVEEAIIEPSTGVGKINFDADFVNAFENAEAEKLALAALVNSLTEIKEITGLQILVEGKNTEKMKNGTPIKGILERDISLIMPEDIKTNATPTETVDQQTMEDEQFVDDELNLA